MATTTLGTVMVTPKMATVMTAAMAMMIETMWQPMSLAGATPNKMILMRKTWLFQTMKQICTEAQRHHSHLFLS
jgi:hypothetical protein